MNQAPFTAHLAVTQLALVDPPIRPHALCVADELAVHEHAFDETIRPPREEQPAGAVAPTVDERALVRVVRGELELALAVPESVTSRAIVLHCGGHPGQAL